MNQVAVRFIQFSAYGCIAPTHRLTCEHSNMREARAAVFLTYIHRMYARMHGVLEPLFYSRLTT